MALVVWNAHRFGLWKTRLWILVVVAYLAMFSVVGIAAGGANMFVIALGGFLGGVVWSTPFAIGQFVISRFSASNDVNRLSQEP
jgi:hypothetical protein